MTGGPVGIAAACDRALHVDQVLDGQRHTVQQTAAGGRGGAARAGQEGAEQVWRRGHHAGRAVSSAASTLALSVVKPKHFFTFHTVASAQKPGEVVAQQSSTSRQP